MTITLGAIDPGKRKCGWARFRGGVLQACGLARDVTGDPYAMGMHLAREMQGAPLDLLFVERMQVYAHGSGRGDPAALIHLSIVGGVAAGTLSPGAVEFVTPREWKGQTPKEIHHKRIRKALVECEIATLDSALSDVPSSMYHDVLDAVGLGLYGCGRRT